MSIVLTLVATGIFLGLLFIILLLIGIIQKKKEMIYVALLCLLLGGACGIWAVYEAVSRTVHTLEKAFEPSTGAELFTSTYGAMDSCTTVMHFKLAQVPRIDNFNLMKGSTCPKQIDHLLSIVSFEQSMAFASSQKQNEAYSFVENWMNIELLGDSIHIWLHEDLEQQYSLTLITNTDSTEFISIEQFDH
ncbi:MAG: hypothetical protein ACOVOO_02360 [Flavobacteriales bacterium]|jgi:hypothetical protein